MKKNLFCVVILICTVLCSCHNKTMSLKDVRNYEKALKYGDLGTVEKYYKKFGDVVLNNFGIPDVVTTNAVEQALYFKHYDIA